MKQGLILFILAGMLLAVEAEESVQFNRDIRPILSQHCFRCHGPDEEARKAKLRLDLAEDARAERDGIRAIVPGDLKASELIHRIATKDADEVMPPPEAKIPLSVEQIALLNRWVKEGAPYAAHWSFVSPEKSEPPEAKNSNWNNNVIDRFVYARLEAAGLKPSTRANQETLIRRLTLDLTGLPPTLAEVDAFLADEAPDAYRKVVERLLKSMACAERLTLDWLDIARYADTNGYSIDDHREMWAWRDWVIKAFHDNKPYDQFIVEQLAGDLLPGASIQQKIATGFLRNSMNTHEGGTIREEYRVAYIADKIDTVSTAFMGLTMKCAQCHDHKYDPISQRDYYRFFAFFNTSSEPGNGAVNANTRPFLAVKSVLQDDESFRASIEQRIRSLRYSKAAPRPDLLAAQKDWEEVERAKFGVVESRPKTAPMPNFPFPKSSQKEALPSWIWADKEGKLEWAYLKKEFELDALPKFAAMFVSCDNEAEVWVNGKPAGKNPDWRKPSILNLRPFLKKGPNLIAVMGKDWDGGSLAGLNALAAFWDDAKTVRYLPSDKTWQGSRKKPADWSKPEGFTAAFVLSGYGSNPYGPVFDKVAGGEPVGQLAETLRIPRAKRSLEHIEALAGAFAKTHAEMRVALKTIDEEIKVLRRMLKAGQSTVMIMDEGSANRKTHMLMRGQYDQPGETVAAGVPEILGPLPGNAPANRLGLGQWLTSGTHPLTARVAVNRTWQMLFGLGLVKTVEDFGAQGEWPSHPELLDWLVVDFVEHGWDLRRLIKRMVLSETYRQSSEVTAELLNRDPYNRLLARAPRHRLPAEFVRDNALAISGLLDRTVGGPSVYPRQPAGLWMEVSHFGYQKPFTAQHFFPDRGSGLYRRSMYTFWKRTSPPPGLTAFDAPNRETCTARRLRTNTPMQALILMNDPQFLEAARYLAGLMMRDGGAEPVSQIRKGFRLATSRAPFPEELRILLNGYKRQLDYFSRDPDKASAYLGGAKVDLALAAMTSTASLILNLDETITRQ